MLARRLQRAKHLEGLLHVGGVCRREVLGVAVQQAIYEDLKECLVFLYRKLVFAFELLSKFSN
jgi:hypothetical protein